MDGLNELVGPTILDRMVALADPTRSRLLLVLERHELTVGELCHVFQMPQSSVSRHLKHLTDEGWVASRREGTSRFYAIRRAEAAVPSQRLWDVVREDVQRMPGAVEDERRALEVLAQRPLKSREFFSSAADQWDRLRDEMFGAGLQWRALPALLDESWTVGDLGCGTGRFSEAIAPFVARVVAIDVATSMLGAAKARCAPLANVEVREGTLEALPLADASLDVAVLMLVLHHLPEPGQALRETARVTKPGGLVLIVDMATHDREEYRQQMGHVWLGFSHEQLTRELGAAGFERATSHPVAPDPRAKGPGLFVARARRAFNRLSSTRSPIVHTT